MSIYEHTAGLRPGRSAFDLSHTKVFDADIGRLVPVLCEDVMPGDVFDIAAINTIRAQPLVTPIYHKLDVYCHYFFVPYRILFKDWEKFITGGASGDETVALPKAFENAIGVEGQVDLDRYGLWDYLGFPMHNSSTGIPSNSIEMHTAQVNDFPWRAYWAIWRDYYRDENHQTTFPDDTGETSSDIDVGDNFEEHVDQLGAWMDDFHTAATSLIPVPCDRLAYRCWSKDYFTSALPWQQRGTSPAIPISGSTSAVFDSGTLIDGGDVGDWENAQVFKSSVVTGGTLGALTATGANNIGSAFNNNTVDFTATGVDISDLRLAVQVQRWMERNARGGYRYNEFIKAHFGVSPNDDRLQRPEYIGGSKQPVIISEVIQSSQTDASPQGNMAGHGMSVSQNFAGRYRVKEHGVIMGIMSIMPEAIYQQGLPRQWTRNTKFDFYSPEFAHLSEQEILKKEVFFTDNTSTDDVRFGFQAVFDEYRTRSSIVCGKMASDLKDWTLSRIFDSPPSLNEEFLTLAALSKNRRSSWAVPGVENATQGQFLIQWRNIIKAVRPMPYIADPGMLDHF